MVTVYGLARCDTCRKARAWLEAQGIAHRFVDYRDQPIPARDVLAYARQLGWEKLVNRASTTWRGLTDAEKSPQGDEQWLLLVAAHPALVRRPLLVLPDGRVVAGFKPAVYADTFAAAS
ncbi:Spx/MgsR family RNA polymerase-binding regulatory protein [Pseudofulvimonas gallinarii]|jgi:Spx/MgsR family transcriptional regulator|uniref:Spx/MgsR family transcriptional regulator n=1 Tax=Pseudofulvimonas gallinarii TaxID=634155 RepID=A0A4R3LEF4_9GAMM|nr:Spx/MgsR family RNA polymerase-binding regulatory protein [Pseudofulvimonas gallinarii]TCS97768.1 Spx/MgsR family transcriptional regulator [Pseudofulvimonas gallinarii]THD13396.1 arsenate reductase [Pseudofulvimonas gallinarii]